MKLVRDKLRVRYDIEPPKQRTIKAWSNKLLETGSLFDKPRSGRTENAINDVEKGVKDE